MALEMEPRMRIAAQRCGKCGKMVSKLYGDAIAGFVKGVCSRCLADYTMQIINKFKQVSVPLSQFLVENKILQEGDKMPMGEALLEALRNAKAHKEE